MPPAPEDPLEAAEWMFLALRQSAEHIMADGSMSSRDQRAELRATAKAMNALMPSTRLLEAERRIREAQDTIGRPRRESKVTPAPAGGPAPLRMTPAPK
jgi:hypothetical protein